VTCHIEGITCFEGLWEESCQENIWPILTPWSRVLLEKLTSKLRSYSRNSPHLWNTKVPHHTHKCPPPVLLNLWVILNMCFLRRGIVNTLPNPPAGGPPLVGCSWLLIQFMAILHIGGCSSIRNLRMHHAVVTGTHIHGYLTCRGS
jgi:hypothetical protein